MLKNLSIQNFRGLNNLVLEDSGTVNLVVGRNDAGKTCLLEAIRLLLTCDPGALRRYNRNRIERRPVDTREKYLLAFYAAQYNLPIIIGGTFDEHNVTVEARVQTIQGEENLPFDLDEDNDYSEEAVSLLEPGSEIVLQARTESGASAIIRQPLQGRDPVPVRQRIFSGDTFPHIPRPIWLGTDRAETWAHARRYSRLYRSGGADALLDILRNIEPRLQELVVLTEKRTDSSSVVGDRAVLEVNIGLPSPLPLESMGDGFSSTIAILSAIALAEKSVCLIDEVENGIHYSLLPKLWLSILSATTGYQAQLWATTHSYDCIAAIHEAFAELPDLLRVHRLERRENGNVIVHTFTHAMLGRALERGLEIR